MWRVVLFAGWTVFVWFTRIRLAWTDSTESTATRLYGTAWAVVLLAGAIALLVACARSRRRGLSDRADVLVFAVYALTVVVWVLSVPGIIRHGGAGFVVVHLVIGALSILLGHVASRWANPDVRDAPRAAVRS